MFSKSIRFLFILTVIISIQGFILASNVKIQSDFLVRDSSANIRINLNKGKTLYDQTQFADSIIYFQSAYNRAVEENNLEQQIKALNWMAMSYGKLGEWQKARSLINQSLQLLQSQVTTNKNLLLLWNQTLNIQGQIEFSTGNTHKALLAWQEAQKGAESLNDFEGIQGNLINQIIAYSALGKYIKAAKIIKQLEGSIEQQPDSKIKIYGLVTLAKTLHKQGQLEDSESLLRKSLTIAEQFLAPVEMDKIKLILANVLKDADKINEASTIYEQIINNSPEKELIIKAELNQLAIAIEQKKYTDIDTLINQIDQEIKTLIPKRNNLYIQINFASYLLNLSSQIDKNYNQLIVNVLTHSLAQGKQIQDNYTLAYSYGMLGKLYLQENRLAEAKQLTIQALSLAESSNYVELQIPWQGQMGRIYQLEGDRQQAIVFYQNAIHNLESISADLYSNNSELQFSFQESVEPIYRELINLLLGEKKPSITNIKKSIEIFEKLHIAELKNFFGDGCLIRKSAEELKDNQGAIIHPIILDDRLVVITSFPEDKYFYHSIDISQKDLETTLIETRNSLHPTASQHTRKELTTQLYDWLIRPIENELATKHISTLIFALDGTMRNLPMSTLHDGQQYLIEKYAIALIPVRVDLLDPQPWQVKQLNALIGGLSESRQGFPALPAVELEIQQVSRQSSSQILLNHNFTQRKLAEQITSKSFPILHLATHGQFSSQEKNTFLLAWDEKIEIRDLEMLISSRNRQQAIEILILSACQTAFGDKRAALGLAGFAMRSGARSVVATLWSVNDESTAQLMVNFYQQLQQPGIRKSEALRQAQLKLIHSSEYNEPYYWSPFVIIGNWL
jgi:CHAT domain-containing protein